MDVERDFFVPAMVQRSHAEKVHLLNSLLEQLQTVQLVPRDG